jgi:class 3 adenylate cyclase
MDDVHAVMDAAGSVAEFGLQVRAGVHTGEVEVMGTQLGGVTVHIGARVPARAAAGELLATSTVRDLVAGSGITFVARGEVELKGIPGVWRLMSFPR